ncbi:hypothetical protein ATANTOWER_026702 [Ataeniobius toweri]|uniref:Platelet-derived growth factor receptor-like protein n=1 Tax=Ataeniobius toweri TaxID=208326 RepID=A0ABU7C5H9_9TELE|nr:hypothetical protein [Ataeniobius toweri]
MNFILVGLLCGLYGVFGKDKEQKGRFSVPLLDVKSQQLVLEANKTLVLNCRGRWELSWAFPAGFDRGQVEVVDSRCGRTHQHYCSCLKVSHSQARHTGLYRCRYRHRTQKQQSVYVYVTDSRQPFVEATAMSPGVLYMKMREPLVIPCRVTNPNITTTLVKHNSRPLSQEQRNIIWNSKQGFTIQMPTYFSTGLFHCEAVIDGLKHNSRAYYVHRTVSSITQVYLNTSGSVQALKGERLALNCTATTELNTRVDITWDYPGKRNNTGSNFKRLVKHQMHVLFYSILTIPKLQRSDRGLYKCRVTSGAQNKQQQVTVTVYDRPFIRLKPRNGSVVEVQAGQKSYKLSPKLRAFPPPEVVWLKDGRVAAEQCSRYHMNGTSLVIRDVAEEDAGKYTVLVRIQQHGLYQNLTLTLVVNVSPKIENCSTAHPTESLIHILSGSGIRVLLKASPLHHEPDATLEEAQGPWARLGQNDGWPLAWVLSPLLGLALGTSVLLSGPGRRRTGFPVQKSERFSSRCLASSPTRDASQRRDCPFVFKRGTVRFLKSLIYS